MRAFALCSVLFAACDPDERVLVGALDGTDAEVAVVVNDTRAQAYVCGGETTRLQDTRWFAGAATVEAGTLDQDGWELAWTAGGGTLTDPAGNVLAWTPDDQTDHAAIYDDQDSGCRDGAIAWDDGASLQGTWGCYATTGQAFEVTPVGTLKIDDTIEASVINETGAHQFSMTKVDP